MVRRTVLLETAYFQDLYAEGLEPGKEPMKCSLVLKRAVQYGLDLVYGCTEPLEVKQSLWQEDSRYADLITRRRHRMAPKVSERR